MSTEDQHEDQATEDEAPDYKALYESAQAEAERWKAQSRKNESRAKGNASAAKQLEDATRQLTDLNERLTALESENTTLRANAERASLVAKVAKETGVPEDIVSALAATDEEGLTKAATVIAETYRTPGGAPSVPEAGTFPRDEGEGSGDWLRDALKNK